MIFSVLIILLSFVLFVITLYIDPSLVYYITKKIFSIFIIIINKINEYANANSKNSKKVINFSASFYVFLGVIILSKMKIPYMKWVVLAHVIFTAYISVKLFKQKNQDVYVTNFLIFSAIYALLITLLFNFFESDLNKFLSSKGNFNQISWLVFSIFFLMITFWHLYYLTAESAIKRFKTINLSELRMVTYKSALQSIVGFIAIAGIASVQLNGVALLILLSINIYALFIFPIIDINIFVLQKIK